jgi:hypothetical protein
MARLVSKIVESARDRHPAFDRQRMPNGVVYRFLADYCQEVQGKIMAIDPTYGGVEQTIVFALPLGDFDAGLELGPGRVVNDIVAVTPDTVTPTQMIPVPLLDRQQRFARNGPTRAAWQEGEVLYLRAPDTLWSSFGSIEVQVVANFTDDDVESLQLPNAVLPLPDAAARMVADALALYMARRGASDPTLPAIDPRIFAAAATESEGAFYDGIRQRHVGRTFLTADVASHYHW